MSKKKQHTGPGAGNTASDPSATVHDAACDSGLEPEVLEESELTVTEALEGEVREWKEYAMRAQAEFENTKRRLETRQADAVKRAGERVIEGLLPVVDDLEYAIRHATDTNNEMLVGVSAIHTKILSVLVREGVEVIDPLDRPFDHNVASAVQMVENADVPDQTVVNVLQKGYQMGSRVVRPAMVVVSTGGPTS